MTMQKPSQRYENKVQPKELFSQTDFLLAGERTRSNLPLFQHVLPLQFPLTFLLLSANRVPQKHRVFAFFVPRIIITEMPCSSMRM